MEGNKKIILYVDDDPDDRELLTDAIQNADKEVEVALAKDGVEALHYLLEKARAGAKLPCLIVLDINMPFLNGRETFERIKADPLLQHVPVIVFSSSERPTDKEQFNALGIEFLTKPSTISYMASIVKHMMSFCS